MAWHYKAELLCCPCLVLDSFAFPIVPLQGTTTVISIKTRFTWDMTFHFFLIHQARRMSSQGRDKLRSASSIIAPHPSASHICQRLRAASHLLSPVQQPQKAVPAKHTPSLPLAIWTPHGGKAWWLFSGALGQKEVSLFFHNPKCQALASSKTRFPWRQRPGVSEPRSKNYLWCHGNQTKNNSSLSLFLPQQKANGVALKDSTLSNHPAAGKSEWWGEEHERRCLENPWHC